MDLRIATHNVLHGMSLSDGKHDDAALGGELAETGADVLALQEVDLGQPRSGHSAQVELVAAGGSGDGSAPPTWSRFVATVIGTPGVRRDWRAADGTVEEHQQAPSSHRPQYGIGLVSRLPVHRWELLRLPASPVGLVMPLPGSHGRLRPRYIADEPRAALAAVIERPDGGVLCVISTHLSFVPGWNLWQLRALRRWADRLPRPVVLAGDLNLPGPLPSRALGWDRLAEGRTYPSPAPRVQLDHLLTERLRTERLRTERLRTERLRTERMLTDRLQAQPALGDPSPGHLVATAGGTIRTAISDHLALWADVTIGRR